jgi:iron-sulfur cluster insertion protein
MSEAATEMATDVAFSDAAARKVKHLIEEEKNSNLRLRIYISGGGCSGFQYGFSFDENTSEGDLIVENGEVALVIDPMSYQYLIGAEVDYTEGLEGEQFVVRNPNATTTCGCGSSFSV